MTGMKITRVTAYPVTERRSFLFIVVETDEGISGLGEAGLTGHARAMMGALDALREMLVGQDPFRIEHLWQTMFRGSFFPGQRVVSSVIAGVDTALWDIKGKALGVPVYELLGGRVRDRVACYPHCTGANVDEIVENARAKVEDGWRFVRWGLPTHGDAIDPRRAVRESVAQFAALRRELGDEIELCFDVHTRLDPSDSVTLCREVEQYHPYFMEDPIRSENYDSYRQLRARTGVPIAAGEQFSSKWEFRQLVEEDLIDYARIDLAICAGLTEAKKIAGWCETHYIRVAVHNPIGPVSSSVCLQLNLAIPNFGVMELPRRPGESLADLVTGQPEWRDGHLLPPTAPGLGIEFNAKALDKYPYDPKPIPRIRRHDGSFTNW
jgi:L-alanine-DL-glutamate epimerase-like enolase superfamily enzyme